MAHRFLAVLGVVLALSDGSNASCFDYNSRMECERSTDTIYTAFGRTRLSAMNRAYNPINVNSYRGKVLLIVNTATYWGSTYQYTHLNALQTRYGSRIQVLAFPCNQFGHQEPGAPFEILNGLRYVRPGHQYVPNFPLFQKTDVNGRSESPIYTYLKKKCPPTQRDLYTSRLYWDPMRPTDIEWNFHKFLVDKTGKVRWSYSQNVGPNGYRMRADIDRLLRE